MHDTLEMRKNMILGQLFTNDIANKHIFNAMAHVPREAFVPEKLHGAAYVDEDLDVGNGRFLMEPLTFAKLLDMAELTPSDRVLNIGCHTGYSAAVLSRLCAMVVATDTDAAALEEARLHMGQMHVTNVNLQAVSSMAEGYLASAPYDVIVIQGAINFISEKLAGQLAPGGRLVTVRNVSTRPGVSRGLGKGLLIRRVEHKLQYREYFDASCALLPGFEQGSSFTF
ncbi:MAG: protein-L-isoaspartate O-methyltransferase [Rickettsiales bacterium]|nr:protein-L-isoaspartate O-methyltransferase [Rickettsiales bacterium]